MTGELSRVAELSYARSLMTAWSPTLEGFRAMFRRPSVSLAEIIWRWSFGMAACVLFGTALIAYLDTLPVSNRELRMLRTGHPALVSQAFEHVFRGSAVRALLAGIILSAALALFWIVIASLGRAATLGALLAYIRERAHGADSEISSRTRVPDVESDNPASRSRLGSLAGLHFLRVALAVTACAAGLGAIVLASMASTKTDPRPGLVFFLATTMLLGIWALWSSLSWFLAAAPIFVIREGKDTFGALLETATLFRKHLGPVISVGSWFGITHLILLIAASSVVMFPLAFTSLVPPLVVFSATLFLTLAYFAIVDALYIGRLAGYVAILEAPASPSPPPASPPPMPSLSAQAFGVQPESGMVDQTETILSDVPPLDTNNRSSLPEASPPNPDSPKSEI
jgi:hypothetical protein